MSGLVSCFDSWRMPVKHTRALLLPDAFQKQQSLRASRMQLGRFSGSEGPRAAELPSRVCQRFAMWGEESAAAAQSWQGE